MLQVLGHRGYISNEHREINVAGGISEIELQEDTSYHLNDNGSWLIEGYDYCNQLKDIQREGEIDKIRILKADGSIMELVNVDNYYSEQGKYAGVYYESGINKSGLQ